MRKSVQRKILELSKKYSHLILNWATGVGKSACAIAIANSKNPAKILLIVAETAHKENWKKEFDKWDTTGILWSKTTVECYQSLKNYKDTEWDVLILDEGHHAVSELRKEYLSTIKAKSVIVLTATISLEDQEHLNETFDTVFYKDVISLQQAIEGKFLPSPKIYVLPLELDKENVTEIIEEAWGNKEIRRKVVVPFERRRLSRLTYPAVHLTIQCTPFQKYRYLTDSVDYYKRRYISTRQEHLKNKWLQLGVKRKRFLAELKTQILRELLEKLKGKRYICFCGSISQADLLGSKYAIHSKKEHPLEIVNEFNKGNIDHLLAVNMLQEGQNLEHIDVGVIAQLDGKERAFIQKFGRTLRAENPIQIILYFKGTRDEEYLRDALEDIDPSYITEIKSIEDLIL